MASKKFKKLQIENRLFEWFLFLYLIIFPFGQLPGLVTQLQFGLPFRVQIIDIIALSIGLVGYKAFMGKLKEPYKYIVIFGLYATFTLILAYFIYPSLATARAFFYLLRLWGYILFGISAYFNFRSLKNKSLALQSLLAVAGFVGLFGWIQYLLAPDLRSLKYLNWDDHYYRLVSTFLDPAFTGILLVLGVISAVVLAVQKKSAVLWGLSAFLVVTVGFTYSRASFLALFGALVYLGLKTMNKRLGLGIIALLLTGVFLLPRGMGGEGVKLERLHSVWLKVENFQDGLELVARSPLFGYGYNTLCSLQTDQEASSEGSNSCGGLDNSYLFIVATTGLVGLFMAGTAGISFWRTTSADLYGVIWKGSVIAVGVHTMFTNTLFYPWVMGWLLLLAAVSRKSQAKN